VSGADTAAGWLAAPGCDDIERGQLGMGGPLPYVHAQLFTDAD